MRLLICFAMAVILCGSQAWADCRSDCEDEYQSEAKSCRNLHDDPNDPDDVGEFEVCMDSAEKEYQSCISECKN